MIILAARAKKREHINVTFFIIGNPCAAPAVNNGIAGGDGTAFFAKQGTGQIVLGEKLQGCCANEHISEVSGVGNIGETAGFFQFVKQRRVIYIQRMEIAGVQFHPAGSGIVRLFAFKQRQTE